MTTTMMTTQQLLELGTEFEVGANITRTSQFYIGQPVIWLQYPHHPQMQGIACDVLRVLGDRVQIEVELTGRSMKKMVTADTLRPACPDCKMWVSPDPAGLELCEGCAELEKALSLIPEGVRAAEERTAQVDLLEEVTLLLEQAVQDEGGGIARYSGIDSRIEGCPICQCFDREVYTALDGEPAQAICERCGLDEKYFATAHSLRYAANLLLYELQKVVDRVERGKCDEIAGGLERLQTIVKMNRKLLTATAETGKEVEIL